MSENKLILDKDALAKMGIKGETIFTIEYDLQSKRKIPKTASEHEKKEIQARNRLVQRFRNKLFHILKYRVMATRHLESSWLIDANKLETAETELKTLMEEMAERGFKTEKRLKIIPILTTNAGFEHYEELKAQFLLKFATEHIQYIDKGLDEQHLANSTLWKCQRAFTCIEELKEELKHRQDLYAEIVDTVALLGDKIAIVEEEMAKWKAEEDEE